MQRTRLAPRVPVVSALFVDAFAHDAPLVAMPRSEVQLVARFGVASGVDVHALGARRRAHRKPIRGGQRAVTARLHLGAAAGVLAVPASEIAGQIVPLAALWGAAATRRLLDELAAARSTTDAALVFEDAIAARAATVRPSLALVAAAKLATTNVNIVADDLGVSERHLRRVFRDATGVSPKAYAKLARFHRALRAARDRGGSWARIAAATGYYDQAHLIAEFRAIAGVTPSVLLAELRRFAE